jgi:hypothetical protein
MSKLHEEINDPPAQNPSRHHAGTAPDEEHHGRARARQAHARRVRLRRKTGEPLISDEQYCAGLRLHADFMASQLSARITTNWESPVAGGPVSAPRGDLMHQSEKILAAKTRYYAALDAVGPELSRILVEVCCFATGIESAERILGWPRRSGKVVLQLALTSLARAYGIIAPQRSAPSSHPV